MDSTGRATIRFLIGTATGAVAACLDAVHWMHSKQLEALIYLKLSLVLLIVSAMLGVWRFIWYRKHRDYFAEEIDHRCSLAKGSR